MRASHDRSLEPNTAHLWNHLIAQPIQFYQEVELPATPKRQERTAKLAVRFCPVQLRCPRRLDNQNPFEVYALYALEHRFSNQNRVKKGKKNQTRVCQGD